MTAVLSVYVSTQSTSSVLADGFRVPVWLCREQRRGIGWMQMRESISASRFNTRITHDYGIVLRVSEEDSLRLALTFDQNVLVVFCLHLNKRAK